MHTGAFDVAVVGLGAIGSATVWRLAQRGFRVLGVDRYAPPHHFGSSHGNTRIIREAYFEHPLYVPLVRRAAVLWGELETGSPGTLLRRTGGLTVGPSAGTLVGGASRSARAHALPHEIWSSRELRDKVPAWDPPDDVAAVWEPRAGVLFPERCLTAMHAKARACGAELLYDSPVTGWTTSGSRAVIATANHDYAARVLVLTAGPWLPELLTGIPLPVTLERQVQFWFDPASHPEWFLPEAFPVFLLEYRPGHVVYGTPDVGHGVKLAFHHGGEPWTLERPRREVDAREADPLRAVVRGWMPAAAGSLRDATVCIYTNAPDGHFIIDRHPDAPGVILASCCSGHGFKFAPAIGEALADLAADSAPSIDLHPFRLTRFSHDS